MERGTRRVGLAALASLLAHALVFAWARQQPAATGASTTAPEPLAFVLIETQAQAPLTNEARAADANVAPTGRARASAPARREHPAAVEANTGSGEPSPMEASVEGSEGGSAGAQEGPARAGVPGAVDLQLRAGSAAVPAAGMNMGVRLPDPPPTGPKLEPKPGGGYRYSSRGFEADIDRDGTVRFDDNMGTELGGQRTGEPSREPAWRDRGGATILSFDLTEAVMRSVGDDPFRVEKQSFMDDTAPLRRDLCEADRKERLEGALLDLNKTLALVWADPRRSPAERRRTLFMLWDECLEGPAAPSASDADLVRTGDQARAVIASFVQRNLPAGSHEAFLDGELYALNARRRSKQPFEPYARLDAGAPCNH